MGLESFVNFARFFVTFNDLSLAILVLGLGLILTLLNSRYKLTKESFSNLLTFLLRSYIKVYILLIFGNFYTYTSFSRLKLVNLPKGWLSFLLCFLLVDFIKYFQHWCGHRFTIFRLGHTVHHSGTHFDITTAIRVPMMLYELLFLLPCFLLGFSMEYILIAIVAQFLYSLLVHINYDYPWLRSLEWILITPRLHKIHHNRTITHNKNFGFIFSFWDRLFKTYDGSLEMDEINIGLETLPQEFNPIMIQIRPYMNYWKKMRNKL